MMADFQVTGVKTVVIPVREVETSRTFYNTVLGLKEDYAADGMVWLHIGNEGRTSLLLHPIGKPEPVENGLVVELAVDNVDAVVAAVSGSAGRVVQQPIDREWGVREAIIVDPDGYRLWLVQPLS